jgi:hypothetical protein
MNKMIAIILLVAGSIFLLAGIIILSQLNIKNKKNAFDQELNNLVELVMADGVLTKNEKETIKKIANEKSLDFDKIILDIENRLNISGISVETEIINQKKKIGDDFEKFVIQKFSRKFFKIKEWAGDKYVNGLYAETTQNPDFLLEFHMNEISQVFAVECKWRSKAYNNEIEISSPDQLKRYKTFATSKGIPVTIAIGLGGRASQPEHLYMVPLNTIKTPILLIDEIQIYEKNIDKNFFFDFKTLELK